MRHAPLPPRTVRAIDRLARRAHAFHRFAHHPLCDRYQGELISLGRRARICRGCASAALGSGAGLVAALVWPATLPVLVVASSLGLVSLWGSLAKRLPKWLGRSTASLCLAFAGFRGLLSMHGAALGLAGGIAVCCAIFLVLYRRRGPDRSPCQTCPERRASPCSGLRPIVRRERAFRRLAQRWLDTATLSGP